jgi:hypothetical protein
MLKPGGRKDGGGVYRDMAQAAINPPDIAALSANAHGVLIQESR